MAEDWVLGLVADLPGVVPPPEPEEEEEDDWVLGLLREPLPEPPAPPEAAQEAVTPEEYTPSREFIPSSSLVRPAPSTEVQASDYRPGQMLPTGVQPEPLEAMMSQAKQQAADAARRMGVATVRGFEDVNRGLMGAVEAAGADVESFGQRAQEQGVPAAAPLFRGVERAGAGIRELGQRAVPEETPFSPREGETPTLIEDVLQAAPSFAAGIGAALAAGPQGALAFLGAQETGGQYKRALAEGATHEQAVQDAVMYGAASALLERYGVSKVLEKAFPGAAKKEALDFVKRWAQASVAEGGTEATQDVASNLSSVLREASEKGLEWKDVAEVFSEENLRQYGRTALVGGILGGAPVVATAGTQTQEQAPESESPEPAPEPPQSGREPAPEPPRPAEEPEDQPRRVVELQPMPPPPEKFRDLRVRRSEPSIREEPTREQRIAAGDAREAQGLPPAPEGVEPEVEAPPPVPAPVAVEEAPVEAPVVETEAISEAPETEARPPSVVERLPAAQKIRASPDEAGFVKAPRGLGREIRAAIDRQVKPQGNLPVSAWKLKLQKDHNLGAHEKGLEFRLRELNQQIRRYDGPLTKKQLTRYLGDALRGTVPVDLRAETSEMDQEQIARIARKRGLEESEVAREFARAGERPAGGLQQAPEFAPLIGKLRADIDAVTRSLRREGLLDDAAARDLERSSGLYVHRSYDAFRGKSKEYLRRVEETPLWNRAKELVSQEYPDFTEEEVDGYLREFIERGDRPTLPGNVPEGAMNRSTLFQRRNVRDLERLLLGERRDIRSQAADTLIGQVSLLEHHRFLKALREDGLGDYLMERPRGRYYRPIDESLSPLAVLDEEGEARSIYRKGTHRRMGELTASGKPGGKPLHTSPEILRELEDAMPHRSEWPLWLKLWSMGNFAVKTNLTVLSPTTTGRNYISNTLAGLANGYLPVGKGVGEGARTVLRDIANSLAGDLRKTYQRFTRLGIMDQGADYGDLRRLGAWADLMRVEEDPGARPARAAKASLRKAGQVYQHGDNFWKILGFTKERARLDKIDPELKNQRPKNKLLADDPTITRLDEEAAEIVGRTLQNYSQLPRLARNLSANPVAAPFFSFTWAMYRNAKQTSLQAAREIRSSKPEVKKVGARRSAGMIAALSLPKALTFFAHYLSNTDDEEEDALREFVAPWDRGAELAVVSKRPGEYTYFNWGFMDYFSKLKEPVRLVLEAARDPERDLSDVAEDVFADYGEEVLFGAMVDALRGETADGYRVWLEEDEFSDRVGKSMEHLWRTGRPGVARNVSNISEAVKGEGPRKLWAEIVALAGPRFVTVDVSDQLDRYGKRFGTNLAEATRQYTQYANRTAFVGEEKLTRGYRRANEERMELLIELRRKMEAAVVLGLPIDEVERKLRDGGTPRKYIDMAWGASFEPVGFQKGSKGHWERVEVALEGIADAAVDEYEERLVGQ